MKALLYAAVLLALGYVAGIRHTGWLVLAFAGGCFFGLLMLAQAVILSRFVRPFERERSENWLLGSRHDVPLTVHSRCPLPCSRVVVRMSAAYDWEKKKTKDEPEEKPTDWRQRLALAWKSFRQRQREKRAEDRRQIRKAGTVPPYGQERFAVPARASHCGRAFFTMRSLRVYDSCGLFSIRRRYRLASVTAAVYPRIRAVSFPPGLFAGDAGDRDGITDDRGRGDEDFRDIRAYREGDPLRRIHWKRSAGREEWLLREFESGEDRGFRLLVDTTGYAARSASGRDRSYAFAAAAAAGLIARGVRAAAVTVTPEGAELITPLRDEEDIRTMLYRMYAEGYADPLPEEWLEDRELFVVNADGQVRYRGQVVCQVPEPEDVEDDTIEDETQGS